MKNQIVVPVATTGAGQTGEPAGFINENVILDRVPVCRRTLKAWRDAGKIPFAKIGKRVLYHWPSVEQALLRMQRGGAA
jgi:hypothetical protein